MRIWLQPPFVVLGGMIQSFGAPSIGLNGATSGPFWFTPTNENAICCGVLLWNQTMSLVVRLRSPPPVIRTALVLGSRLNSNTTGRAPQSCTGDVFGEEVVLDDPLMHPDK